MSRYLLLSLVAWSMFSCANAVTAPKSDIQHPLTFQGVPDDLATYRAEIGYFDSNKKNLGYRNLGSVTADTTSMGTLTAPAGTTSASVYLFDPTASSSAYPKYVQGAGLDSRTSILSPYWLDYVGYFETGPQKVLYGLNSAVLEKLTTLSPITCDFRTVPYRFFLVDNPNSNLVTVNWTTTGNKTHVVTTDTLATMRSSYKYLFDSDSLVSGSKINSTKSIYYLVKPLNYSVASTASLTFVKVDRLPVPDLVADLVATEDPSVMYLLTKNSHTIYQVDPLKRTLTKKIQLALQGMNSLAYSAVDKKIYTVSTNNATYAVYDLATGQETQKDFSTRSGEKGVELVVDATNRRIYISSYYSWQHYTTILNQDSGTALGVATANSPNYSSNMIISDKTRSLYRWTSGTLSKYDVSKDVIGTATAQYSPSSGDDRSRIQLSPDQTKIVYQSINEGYIVRYLNASTLATIGVWSVGAYPERAVFSADGNWILATNSHKTLFMAKTTDFTQVKSWTIPSNDSSLFLHNADGTIIVGVSPENTYTTTPTHALYFIDTPTTSTVSPNIEPTFEREPHRFQR